MRWFRPIPIAIATLVLMAVVALATSHDVQFLLNIKGTNTEWFRADDVGGVKITGRGLEVTGSGTGASRVTMTMTRFVNIPVLGCFDTTDNTVLTTTAAPTVTVANNIYGVGWTTGQVDRLSCTFRVPNDYSSGGSFVLLTDQVTAGTDTAIDYDLYINTGTGAFDAAVTNQNSVTISNNATTQSVLTLTPVTDIPSANDWVTVSFWRQNLAGGSGSTATIRIWGATYSYTASR